jgi:hypothetical protein
MSHTALRRVVIRLLHDPELAERLAVAPDDALADADLSDDEQAWLCAVPAAAWRTDPERPRRVLAALADEYRASLALAPARRDDFFRSPHFHRAVQERGSLALAFGRHMADDADPRVVAVARLELTTANVRRAPRRIRPSPPGELRLAPSACVVRVARGADDVLAALRAARAPGAVGPDERPLLVVRTADGLDVTIERLEDELARLLERARDGASRAELEALVVALGGDAAEAASVIERLVADGLLA